jgi:AraC family transcriptional regulator
MRGATGNLPNMRFDDPNASHIASTIVSTPDGSDSHTGDGALLLPRAAAAAGSDSDRDYLRQAKELLRVGLERAGCLGNESPSEGRLAHWQANRVIAYIESNIDLNIRVADLAGVVRLSTSHFSRAFKASTGRPPSAYVKALRVCYAQVIMLNTREPLSRVALDCGMSDQAHFSRVFRKIVGISPSAWRRQSEPVFPISGN